MFNFSLNFQGKPKHKQTEKGERLFHAKDFQSLMKPCFTFCRILGIFPYKLNASIFEISKPHYILWIVIICVYSIYVLITLYDSSIFERIDMIILPSVLATYCVFVFGGFIMIVTFLLCNPRMRLLEIILKISSSLPEEYYQKLSRQIHTKDIIGLLCLVVVTILELPRILKLQFNSLFYAYSILVVFQMDMLYMNCVCVLKICFKRINDNLMHIDWREPMTNDKSRGYRLIYHKQRNPLLIIKLNALKKEHLIIGNTIHMLNRIFCLQLLATVIMTFSDITMILYYYILVWQHILLEKTWIIMHIIFILYVAYYVIKITLIIWACETGKNQALQITTTIHDILNSITDKQIKNELQLFSLQTLHCENTFSAKGLTMDAKLLAEIMGTIVTYVVILFQFKYMLQSCERNITEQY